MSQFESAIIFYSDTVGLAHGIDYWYLAHFGQSHVPFTADGIQIGFYPTGGPNTLSMFGVFVDSLGRDDVTIETNTGNILLNSRRQLTLQSAAAQSMFLLSGNDLELEALNTGLVYLASAFGNISFRKDIGSNTEIAELRNLGTQPNIKALNSSTIDVWQTAITTQTMNGVAGCTTAFAWRQTIDWICEVRMLFNTPGGSFFTPVPFFSFALPGTFPTIDSVAAVNSQGPHLIGIASAPQTVCSVRLDPGGTGFVFNNNTPAGCNVIEISGTFTLAKP
jgi:hypothetical protein